ncbi:hypothetical protein FQR65_LT17604 [Abscondita terminalis]|nr:hypothetical protein FQR65_LT17604 [Abscondita terminalis]
MEKWYVGANTGFGIYNIQKWNYWNSDKYQEGFNFMLGVTVGYQMRLSDCWSIDFYAGGGTSQSFYHGWYKDRNPKERYDSSQAWNKSGNNAPDKLSTALMNGGGRRVGIAPWTYYLSGAEKAR